VSHVRQYNHDFADDPFAERSLLFYMSLVSNNVTKSRVPGSNPFQERSQNESHQLKVPQISLQKGGGALKGIGEKFAANPVTGTGYTKILF
jgi:hypothetical protein